MLSREQLLLLHTHPRTLPPDPYTHEMRGLAYFYLRNRQAAINDFQRAASIYWGSNKKDDYFKTLEVIEAIRQPRTTQIPVDWSGVTLDYSERQTKC